jgi:hypothetical protein
VFLLPNVTALIQPIDQLIIANFKLRYLQRTFKELTEVTDGKNQQSIADFWKSCNIMNAIRNISTI